MYDGCQQKTKSRVVLLSQENVTGEFGIMSPSLGTNREECFCQLKLKAIHQHYIAEDQKQQFIASFDKGTAKLIWRTDRDIKAKSHNDPAEEECRRTSE
jgi:hypothetical protein